MRSKQAAPLNATQASRFHSRPFGAALLLLAGGAWLAPALLARSMGIMPVTMVIAMPSFVAMWTLMVAAMMVPSITLLASRYLRVAATAAVDVAAFLGKPKERRCIVCIPLRRK